MANAWPTRPIYRAELQLQLQLQRIYEELRKEDRDPEIEARVAEYRRQIKDLGYEPCA